ncbi:hypothetical protein L1887_23697 [Cichorium endivia]|nr:hypothetical protein L1887_23697 [Cichorium endivia]
MTLSLRTHIISFARILHAPRQSSEVQKPPYLHSKIGKKKSKIRRLKLLLFHAPSIAYKTISYLFPILYLFKQRVHKNKEKESGGEVWCGTREVMREKTSTSRQGEGGGGKRQLAVKEVPHLPYISLIFPPFLGFFTPFSLVSNFPICTSIYAPVSV